MGFNNVSQGLKPEEVEAMKVACERAIAYRQGVLDRPGKLDIDITEALHRFGGALPEEGRDPDTVIKELADQADAGLLHLTSPRWFAYVAGSSHPAGVAADTLVSAWGQNAAMAETTPATAAIEQTAGKWMLDLLGLPKDSGVGFVTGGTVANSVGISAARNALLHREGWDVEAKGLFGAPEISVVIGDEAHSSVYAALRYNGLGAERVHKVATDDDGRILADDFERVIAPLSAPILVIVQAGHINSCGFDPFDKIIPVAHAKNAWVHVDGAFGLWMNSVPELSPRLAGVELADSWSTDLHKWLNAPYDAGLIISKDPVPLARSMSERASYLPEVGAWDPSDYAMELSRRARGVPSYAILKTLGKSGLREMVALHCRLAARVAATIEAEPGLTVLNEVHGNQVAIRCGSGRDSDEMTRETLRIVHQEGDVYPSHGFWRGCEIIRISVISYATQEDDVDRAAKAIIRAWKKANKGRHD